MPRGSPGSLLLHYPIYGGIMGIMTATGLAGVIAQWFVAIPTPTTLPFGFTVMSVFLSLVVFGASVLFLVR